jgi:hypothetical protein
MQTAPPSLLRWSHILRLCFSEGIPKRSVLVAVVVGTILNLINQGDALFRGGHVDLLKLALTYAVPYCVATYGAVSYRLRLDADKDSDSYVSAK